jgi:hypothetical protein
MNYIKWIQTVCFISTNWAMFLKQYLYEDFLRVPPPTTMRASCGCHLRRGSCIGLRLGPVAGSRPWWRTVNGMARGRGKRKTYLGEDKEGDKSRVVKGNFWCSARISVLCPRHFFPCSSAMWDILALLIFAHAPEERSIKNSNIHTWAGLVKMCLWLYTWPSIHIKINFLLLF